MKKIAILTLNGYFNHGNRLQNYALQEYLKQQNFEIETLKVSGKKKFSVRPLLSWGKKLVLRPHLFPQEISRLKKFRKFTNEKLQETKDKYYIDQDLNFLDGRYDAFVVGSDQVWNPTMGMASSKFFLNFADEKKRISYAASFGVSSIEDELKEDYRRWLGEIPHISVREEDGKKIVEKLTGKNVPVVVDPTMLLTPKMWSEILNKPKHLPKKSYLLTYFLGDIDPERDKKIEEIAKIKGLEIVNVGDINSAHYNCGPGEFLYYIKESSIFCTDSFHGAVFSILFEKPFVVFERNSKQSMFSRLETLLEKFNLEERNINRIEINESIFNCNFGDSKKILEAERTYSKEFFDKAFDEVFK